MSRAPTLARSAAARPSRVCARAPRPGRLGDRRRSGVRFFPRARAGPRPDRDPAPDPAPPPSRLSALGAVTRAVLAFHDAEGNGNGDRARGGEATVPLASWAKRYGWDVAFAERVLWESDCPMKGGVETMRDARTVDARLAYVALWITHVETDHVVQAILDASRSLADEDARETDREKTRSFPTKRRALDAARGALERAHPAAVPTRGTNIANRTTAGAFGDVVKSLRRRYKVEADFPFVLAVRRDDKKHLVYACAERTAPASAYPAEEGWEVAFGEFGGALDASAFDGSFSAFDASAEPSAEPSASSLESARAFAAANAERRRRAMGMGVGGDYGGGRDAVPPAALGEDDDLYEKSARRVFDDASREEEEEEDSLSARRERRAARWALPESVRGDPPNARARDGDEADGDEAVSAGREAEEARRRRDARSEAW